MTTTKAPVRVQRKRTKGWKMPPNTVYVGRPSKWGNPFKVEFDFTTANTANWVVVSIGHETIGNYHWTKKDAMAVALSEYRRWLDTDEAPLLFSELRGKNLACWCPLNQPCHADVLLELANR